MITDINEIIIRYLDGSADMEEKMCLLQWLKLSDGNRSDFMMTRDLWLSCHAAMGNEVEVDIALDKLRNRILQEQERLNKPIEIKKRSLLWRWMGIAAALFLLIGISYRVGYQQANHIFVH